MKNLLSVLIAVLAFVPTGSYAADQPFFAPDKLVINGQDVTQFHGAADVEVPQQGGLVPIEIYFHLNIPGTPAVEQMIVTCHGGQEGWPAVTTYHWDRNCFYDPATRNGLFKITTFWAARRVNYRLTVNVGQISPDAPEETPYTFWVCTYPALGGVCMDALPFYTDRGLLRDIFMDFHPATYQRLSRDVPPNTSLYFTFHVPAPFREPEASIVRDLRIILVKLGSQDARDPFRPVFIQSELPKGDETLLYDGANGGARNGFKVAVKANSEGNSVWIRKPAPAGPVYENLPYLEPGCAYSLQFELTCAPYAGKRYEATRFCVRPALTGKPLEVTADYQAASFVDWQGDWFNGHLLGSDDTPAPFWGGDYLLQKQMRDKYPDLWRMIDNYYLSSQFSSLFFESSNLFRDRSMRSVTQARRISPHELVITLAHFEGARYFHDPDNANDTLDSHPIVANGNERIFSPGDSVLVQANHGGLIEARVKEVRPASNQLVLETSVPIWPVHPEGPVHDYPAVLGQPGSDPTTIALAARFEGTYVRQRNGRPFVNWGTLDYKYDFYVHAMQMRVSIENYGPHGFTGDAVTGHPSLAGWQNVSDCSYYVMRHLLKRYHANLDTFNHPIYGEGAWRGEGGKGYVALYDYYADGILRAYEEVLGVKGEDYRRVQIGMGGVNFAWNQDFLIRNLLAHCVPARLESVFPPTAPAERFTGDLPTHLVGSDPLYYFTPQEREDFHRLSWQYNACFLDAAGKPVVGPGDWDSEGRLTPAAVARLTPGWRHSKWLLENTRYGKGTPFRQVSVEGYGYPAEELAKCILFEKELLAQIDANLRASSSERDIQTFLQGVSSGTKQLALFSWSVSGAVPVGRPFQGTGYWPTYFADLMRRILAETARHPSGIYDHGTFTYDTFIAPDNANGGINSDTATFTTDATPGVNWVDLGGGRRLQVQSNVVTIEKDVRHLVRMVGMMTHRLAALADQTIDGHVISGIMSKYDDQPGNALQTGDAPGDQRRFWVLLYDHNPADLESQDTARIPLTLHIRGLPDAAKSGRVTVYRVDRDHGSIFTVTEAGDWTKRQTSGNSPRTYSQGEINLLEEKSKFALDEDFEGNGRAFAIDAGALDLHLGLGTNRVLLVEVDW